MLVLTESMLQAILVYQLVAVPLSRTIRCKRIILRRYFLWRYSNGAKRWSLVEWERLILPKLLGGLGLHDSNFISITFGAEVWWQWVK